MSGAIETCEVDGCDNRAHTFIEKEFIESGNRSGYRDRDRRHTIETGDDDSIEGVLYCKKHFREILFGETPE